MIEVMLETDQGPTRAGRPAIHFIESARSADEAPPT